MPWLRFSTCNAAGGLLWAALYAFGAYGLGSAATSVGSGVTVAGLAVTVVLISAVAVVVRRRLPALQARAQAAYPRR